MRFLVHVCIAYHSVSYRIESGSCCVCGSVELEHRTTRWAVSTKVRRLFTPVQRRRQSHVS